MASFSLTRGLIKRPGHVVLGTPFSNVLSPISPRAIHMKATSSPVPPEVDFEREDLGFDSLDSLLSPTGKRLEIPCQ